MRNIHEKYLIPLFVRPDRVPPEIKARERLEPKEISPEKKEDGQLGKYSQ